jgi:hypothetical protein
MEMAVGKVEIDLGYNLSLYDNIWGISCVESNYLVSIRHAGIPYPCLFYKSWIDMRETIHSFVSNKWVYARFKGLERLQDVGLQLGISRIHRLTIRGAAELYELFAMKLNAGAPVLIQVNPARMPGNLGILPFRDDHFVMVVGLEGDEVTIMDDYPRRLLRLNFQALMEAYESRVIHFDNRSEIDLGEYQNQIKGYPIIGHWNGGELTPFVIDEDNILHLRDAVGILRISRRRLKEWEAWYSETSNSQYEGFAEAVTASLVLYDKLYALLEMFRLRKQIKNDKIQEILNQIHSTEKLMISERLKPL